MLSIRTDALPARGHVIWYMNGCLSAITMPGRVHRYASQTKLGCLYAGSHTLHRGMMVLHIIHVETHGL